MAGASYFMTKPMFQSSLFNILSRIVGRPVQEEESAGKAYDFSGRQILLAEDMELNREVAVRMLNRVGVEVSCAENGKIALERYEQAPDGFFDCILLDVNMPEMDGYETVAAIRRSKKPDAVTVPVFAMTANAFAEDTQYSLMLQAFEAGDASLAFQHAHSLKGIAGNLSFVKLYSGLEVLEEELRHGDLNRAGETLPEVRKAYEDIMEALGEGTVTDS